MTLPRPAKQPRADCARPTAPNTSASSENTPAPASGQRSPSAPAVKGTTGSTAEHRVAREVALIRTKLEGDKTNVNAYLQLLERWITRATPNRLMRRALSG